MPDPGGPASSTGSIFSLDYSRGSAFPGDPPVLWSGKSHASLSRQRLRESGVRSPWAGGGAQREHRRGAGAVEVQHSGGLGALAAPPRPRGLR